MVEYLVSLGNNFLLKNTTGFSAPVVPWASTVLIPLSEASTCTRNHWLKSGLCNTGSEHTLSFKALNDFLQASVHSTGFFPVSVSKSVNSSARVEKSGMNRQYQPRRPRKDQTAFFEPPVQTKG